MAFYDISLYTPTQFRVGTREYWLERALLNYMSDLYVSRMYGYKPPNTSRVTIQPDYYNIWTGPHKNGSLVHTAPEFNYEKFQALDRQQKYQCLLDLIQTSMLDLSRQFNWDESVFKRAYDEIIANQFRFSIDHPFKLSKNKKKKAQMSIEKTETITSLYVSIECGEQILKIKLLDMDNRWCFDPAYKWVKGNKWLDNDRFGFTSKESDFSAWYSLSKGIVEYEFRGEMKTATELKTFFNIDNRHYNPA